MTEGGPKVRIRLPPAESPLRTHIFADPHAERPGTARKEPTLTRSRAARRQSIESAPLLGQQPAGQPTFNLSSRLMTQIDAEAFEGSRWWDNDPTLPAFLDNEP